MPETPSARLIILRHAKSAWPDGVRDQDRPLSSRGRRDAPAAGRLLHDAHGTPDAVVCSPARRTCETWELVAAELGGTPEVAYDPRVYGASEAELLDVVRETDPSYCTLLLIGHSPAVQELALTLSAEAATDEHLEQAREKFPTSAFAVLGLSGTWKELAPDRAVLLDFAVPRGRRS